jgi:hypothetical protein
MVQQASETAGMRPGKRLPTRKCKYPLCGATFQPKKSNQVYCQPAHRQADWRRRHGHSLTIVCPRCSGEVEAEVWVRASRSA